MAGGGQASWVQVGPASLVRRARTGKGQGRSRIGSLSTVCLEPSLRMYVSCLQEERSKGAGVVEKILPRELSRQAGLTRHSNGSTLGRAADLPSKTAVAQPQLLCTPGKQTRPGAPSGCGWLWGDTWRALAGRALRVQVLHARSRMNLVLTGTAGEGVDHTKIARSARHLLPSNSLQMQPSQAFFRCAAQLRARGCLRHAVDGGRAAAVAPRAAAPGV